MQPQGAPHAPAATVSRVERMRAVRRAEHRRIALIGLGTALVLIGLVTAGNIGWFYFRSHVDGQSLVRRERTAIARAERRGPAARAASATSPVTCAAPSDTAKTPQGLLEASSIGMTAPVLGGDGDTQLSVAVGHVPTSAWPGQPGTTVLVAHDVTYFSDIGQLGAGAVVEYATPCATYLYQVSGHEVVKTGSPIYSNPTQPELVLETCYPPNALYLTDQRYLVTASLVSAAAIGVPTPHITAPITPSVPAPNALAAQGLTLATNDAPLGTLTLDGSPSASWEQSMAPYDDEAAALAEYFGAIRSVEQGQPAWWSDLAPAVPMTAAGPLAGARIEGYELALGVTLDAWGNTLTGATLSGHILVATGSRPGAYAITVTIAAHLTQLVVTGWAMTPI